MVFDGTTATFFPSLAASAWAWLAAITTLPLFGKSTTSATSKLRMACSKSCVLGFIVCPPETMQCAPRLLNTFASPSPGATAITPMPSTALVSQPIADG